jgi:adenylate cyclase
VFIFIALRTLHFEVRYVSLAGLIAATGWLGLVLYVLASNSSGSMVTRDYVEYMTSNSVLLGAEFDKIMSILTVTLILAVAIARARRLLVHSVADAEAVQQLSRFVPTEVADSVKEAGELRAGTGVLREATILFVDLEGFTTLSEGMPPTKVISILNDYFAAVSAPIEAEGGVINQFQGDAILASFNLPASNPEHAAAAVRAALQILELLRHRVFQGERLQARVGLNSGTVIGGLVGTGTRLSYTVHGDDVNLAARLEQLNKRHETRLLLSEHTCELAGWDNFPFRRIGVDKVRGRSRALTVFTLDGPGKTDGGDG